MQGAAVKRPPPRGLERAQKRACTHTDQKKPPPQSEAQQDGQNRFKRLANVHFPDEMWALPHVLKRIDELAMTPDEAAMEAAETNQVEWLQWLIDTFYTKDYCAVAGAASIAAAKGYLEVVEILLPELYESYISGKKKLLNAVLDEAAANGHLDVVKFAVDHADTKGYWIEYQEKQSFPDALGRAVLGGHVDVALYLLQKDYYHWHLVDAFEKALELWQVRVADMIHSVYPYSNKGKDMFVDCGSCAAVKYLYRYADDEMLSDALVEAAKEGNLDVVKLLLGTGDVALETYDRAFMAAAKASWCREEVLECLYRTRQVSLQTFLRAFAMAPNVEVIKFLHTNEDIPSDSIVAAFQSALGPPNDSNNYRSKKDSAQIIKYLSKENCIPSELMTEAFTLIASTKICRYGVLQSLCSDDRVSLTAITEICSSAIADTNVVMLESLFQTQRISAEEVSKLILDGLSAGNLQSRKALLRHPSLTLEIKCQTLIDAAERGLKAVVMAIFKRNDIPRNTIQDALASAQSGKIKRFLGKKLRQHRTS